MMVFETSCSDQNSFYDDESEITKRFLWKGILYPLAEIVLPGIIGDASKLFSSIRNSNEIEFAGHASDMAGDVMHTAELVVSPASTLNSASSTYLTLQKVTVANATSTLSSSATPSATATASSISISSTSLSASASASTSAASSATASATASTAASTAVSAAASSTMATTSVASATAAVAAGNVTTITAQ